jgi:hypothetical protein
VSRNSTFSKLAYLFVGTMLLVSQAVLITLSPSVKIKSEYRYATNVPFTGS